MSLDLININRIESFPVITDGFVFSEHADLDDFRSQIVSEYGDDIDLTLLQWLYEADNFIAKCLLDLKIIIQAANGCDLNGILLQHCHRTRQVHLFVVEDSVLSFYVRDHELEGVKCYCSESVALEALIRKGYFLLQAA